VLPPARTTPSLAGTAHSSVTSTSALTPPGPPGQRTTPAGATPLNCQQPDTIRSTQPRRAAPATAAQTGLDGYPPSGPGKPGYAAECQEGNPASFLVVPTITELDQACDTAGMSPGIGPAIGDGQSPAGWERVESLGVAEIVMTILRARKTMPSATAATVSRERHGDAFHVRVRLLKDSPSPPDVNPRDPGGTGGDGEVIADFIASQLGKDLADAFGNHDVIILK
jgi:hypothetical protein